MVHFQALFSLLGIHQKGQSKLGRTNKQTTAIILELLLGLHTLYYLSHSRRLNLSRASWHDHQLQKQDVIILETCPLLSSDYTVDKSRTLFIYHGNFCNSNFHNVVQKSYLKWQFFLFLWWQIKIWGFFLKSNGKCTHSNRCVFAVSLVDLVILNFCHWQICNNYKNV